MFGIFPLQHVCNLIWEHLKSPTSEFDSVFYFFKELMKRQISWGQHDTHSLSLTHNYQECLCSVILLFIFIHHSSNTCQSHLVRSQRNNLSNLRACCFSFSDLYSNKTDKQYCDIAVISPVVYITLSDANLEFIKKV